MVEIIQNPQTACQCCQRCEYTGGKCGQFKLHLFFYSQLKLHLLCQIASLLMLYLSNIKWQDGEGSSALHVVTEQLQEAAEEEAQNLVRRSTQLKKMTIIITLAMVVVQFP